jgi:hypothetical protein
MRSFPFMLAGAVALAVVAGCGSSVEKLFPESAGGTGGGTGATGGSGSTESSTGAGASTGAGETAVSATGSGAGSATGSGAAGSGGSATSSGSGAASSGVSTGSGPTSSGVGVGVGSAVASSGSGGGSCSHDVCEVGEPLDWFCSDCTMKICQQDSSCCDSWWHEGCAYLAAEQCGCGPPSCASCSEFLNGTGEPLCPWSEPVAEQLLECVCGYGCPSECGDACMGSFTTAECQSCVVSTCQPELDACLNDF